MSDKATPEKYVDTPVIKEHVPDVPEIGEETIIETENPEEVESIDVSKVSTSNGDSDDDVVLPKTTLSGENVTVDGESDKNDNSDDNDGEIEKVFSSFPCNIVPEVLSRLTKTPVKGEHLEVKRNSNGRLRITVPNHYTEFSPYTMMTHRGCVVCGRKMRENEMHLNFPADLDRRRIWANLLGFKYKDILRTKVGPSSNSIAGMPICTEHFAEECFRNHNFNKAAIEAFGVPVAISPHIKTTPSKKRVPWVCTICDFSSASVVELQQHLLQHVDKMINDKTRNYEVPEAGFMCPFCRKCTYGYRTISGFRRHLVSAPIQHCHLKRIYEFAKMNCRLSELEPIDVWENWTRRNVYVAYHGCEPPVDEVLLTPSPQKSPQKSVINQECRENKIRKKAIRSLSFVGKDGGSCISDTNLLQRAVRIQFRKMEEDLKDEREKAKKEDAEKVSGKAKSVASSPVKRPVENEATSCPGSPAKKRKEGEEVEKDDKLDDLAFARMIEKRSRAVQRLISAKGTQTAKPRKSIILPRIRIANQKSATPVKTDEKKADEKKLAEKEDERPLKSTLAKSFAAGEKMSIAQFHSSPAQTLNRTISPQKSFINDLSLESRLAAGGGVVRARRPIILSSRGSMHKKTSAEEEKKPEEPRKPMTIVEALQAKNDVDNEDEILDVINTDGDVIPSVEDIIRASTLSKLTQEWRKSRLHSRRMEAERARQSLFGDASSQ